MNVAGHESNMGRGRCSRLAAKTVPGSCTGWRVGTDRLRADLAGHYRVVFIPDYGPERQYDRRRSHTALDDRGGVRARCGA